MALVSELVTKVTADPTNFISGMLKATAVTAAFVGAFVAVDKITDKIDNLGKQAQKLGVDFESFQGLAYAATIANVPMEKLELGLSKLNKTVFAAATGNDEAAQTFRRLGLNAKELMGLSLDQQYTKISDAINNVTNKNAQLAISMKLFGKGGSDQLLLIRANAAGLIEEFDKLGLTITESQRAASESFQDTKKKLETVLSGIADQVAADIAPAFTVLIEELTKSITGVGDLKEASRSMASGIVSSIQVIVSGFDIFLSVLDKVRDKIDFIITDLGNASQRFAMVGRAILNQSVDPTLIGTLNPVGTAPGSSMGGSTNGLQAKLAAIQNQLSETVYTSFIAPAIKAGDALTKFSDSAEKATSTISTMLGSGKSAAVADRLKEILGDKTTDSREVYKDDNFTNLARSIFDQVQSNNLNEGDIGRINNQLTRLDGLAQQDGGGVFNKAPNIGAANDLKKFVEEQLSGKNAKPIQLIVSTTEGFNVTVAESSPMKAAIINGVNKLTAEQARSVGR